MKYSSRETVSEGDDYDITFKLFHFLEDLEASRYRIPSIAAAVCANAWRVEKDWRERTTSVCRTPWNPWQRKSLLGSAAPLYSNNCEIRNLYYKSRFAVMSRTTNLKLRGCTLFNDVGKLRTAALSYPESDEVG